MLQISATISRDFHAMPDPIFNDPRVVVIYDAFDGARADLAAYMAIAHELKAKAVLDVGCGTGVFACQLSAQGFDVVGVDPAAASLAVARQKPHAENVQWILGNAADVPPECADLAVMTGNVAQMFLTDDDLAQTLAGIRQALRPNGHLVFEVRDPAQKAWLKWTRAKTYQRLNVMGIGPVEGWCDVLDVISDVVTFRWTYVFEGEGTIITSDSTLRFTEKGDVIKALECAGYVINDIRDAPDRPHQEFVFIATLASAKEK